MPGIAGNIIPEREPPADVKVVVDAATLFEAWSALEYLVLSLQRLGSHYAAPSAEVPQLPEQRAAMLDDLHAMLSPELIHRLNRARVRLGDCLPDEEAEAVSEAMTLYAPTGPLSPLKRAANSKP